MPEEVDCQESRSLERAWVISGPKEVWHWRSRSVEELNHCFGSRENQNEMVRSMSGCILGESVVVVVV